MPELDVASQGETIEEAVRNLQDAVDTYVSALSEMGDLRAVLDGRGLKPVLRERKAMLTLKFLLENSFL